jgi:hypothetical protein
MPMQKATSARTIFGSHFCFCASVPNFSSTGPLWRSEIQWAPTGTPAASSSSVTT